MRNLKHLCWLHPNNFIFHFFIFVKVFILVFVAFLSIRSISHTKTKKVAFYLLMFSFWCSYHFYVAQTLLREG
jgi:hypothetical protein